MSSYGSWKQWKRRVATLKAKNPGIHVGVLMVFCTNHDPIFCLECEPHIKEWAGRHPVEIVGYGSIRSSARIAAGQPQGAADA